ncbi:MAG: DUF507 family protein [Candidatus Schekmanbacteria bacterium]|nr:DUF507 family protein [Candidatus Schekmanbacteria bacterium]
MRYSQARINKVSKKITDTLFEKKLISNGPEEAEDIRYNISKVLSDEFRIEEIVDEEVRRIIRSYSRPIDEGSREWDILYKKHYEEQMGKRRRF